MSLNSSQRWRLEKLIGEIVTETENGFAVNREKTINEIQAITENPATIPACPMCSWSGRSVSACFDVQMGKYPCRNCYGDVVESLKPLEKVAKGNPGKQSFPTVSSKKEEVV